MAWLFLTVALGAFLMTLPGGTRSSADRRLSQSIGITALAAAFYFMRLGPLAAITLMVGAGLYGIGALRDRLMGGSGFQDLGEGAGGDASRPVRPGEMSKQEALAVLGLADAPSADEVRAAHKRMIAKAHPDSGGSDYLAAKINAARDRLLD